ncbi:Plasmid stabilization system [Aequoribacter fuscus]|uniref:Plasmid stabilization system n=1 Tax=Aequoribacter fuscus TaxID=2518989 RepID=F3L5B0_9GAMM|nr:type II toxin-antitoxin system RelE/ParE family toxin [Aequoribacter fuscus]EGG28471.1 Plasmid stabilization system [Aequoribacter fuscus]
MGHSVYLTDDAAADLEDLYGYIEQQDVPGKADYVLDKIEKALIGLASNPERGAYPQE